MRKIAVVFGIAALAAVVFWTLPTAAFGFHLGPFYFHLHGHHYRRHHVHARVNPNKARTRPNVVSRLDGNTDSLESCARLVPSVTDLPINEIREAVHPTPDQEAALENLKVASSQASDIIKSTCPAAVPFTPVGRLDLAERQLDTTIKAIQIVRSPLERFYEALTDEQRGQFKAINGSAEGARSSDMATLCSQLAGSFIDLPAERIQQVVRPTAQQQSAFDDLKKTTQNAGDQMQSSCPTAEPKSLLARLYTEEARLSVVADAIKAVRPDLKKFYASLNDDQRARFNTMGPPPLPTSSSRPRQQ